MTEKFTKAELVAAVAESAETSKASIERILSILQDTITDAVKDGKKVTLPGFVSFTPVDRDERQARNPQTGETVTIPAKRVVKVKPMAAFAQAVEN